MGDGVHAKRVPTIQGTDFVDWIAAVSDEVDLAPIDEHVTCASCIDDPDDAYWPEIARYEDLD